MSSERLRFALTHLRSSDWERFEKLCSAFLAAEFIELRTVAAPSGDGGRDSELFSSSGEPDVVVQYSVTVEWADKIRNTIARLKKTKPETSSLIYMSNQQIGAAADDLKRDIRRKSGISVDTRDRNWFLDRVLSNTANERAAEELARVIVDPILADEGIRARGSSELSSPEAVAALTYLSLLWKDDIREKSLTKTAFEALVRAALTGTNSANRLGRKAIKDSVKRLFPEHPPEQVDGFVDIALKRLTKKAIRHWQLEDEFCLSFEETQRISDYKISAALADEALSDAIMSISHLVLEAKGGARKDCGLLSGAIRTTVEGILLARSQAFAAAVQVGTLGRLANLDFRDAVNTECARHPLPKRKDLDWVAAIQAGVREVLLSGNPAIHAYFKTLADAFTLLAFLRQTPDVQGAVEKMFSHGELWLDATIVLPLISESLEEEYRGRFTLMIEASRNAGLKMYVTSGVIEEVDTHMNKALACLRMGSGQWRGSKPFLLERYLETGRSAMSFASWIENFKGNSRPEADLEEYLKEQYEIARRDLAAERAAADPELCDAMQQIWHEAHSRRRQGQVVPVDEMVLTRLVEHDVESFCGVIQRRKSEKPSPFGYSAWWLTIDRKAFNLQDKLSDRLGRKPPDSPVLSADFLLNYLAFGPLRKRVPKSTEFNLPLVMDLGLITFIPPEILDEAEAIREELKDLPERVIRRHVRDSLDMAKRRIGPIARAGMVDPIDEMRA